MTREGKKCVLTTHKMTEDMFFIMSQQSLKRAASLVEVVSRLAAVTPQVSGHRRPLHLQEMRSYTCKMEHFNLTTLGWRFCLSHTPTRFYRFTPISVYCATAWWNLGNTKSRHDATLPIQLPDSANEPKPVMEGRKRPAARDTGKPLIAHFLSSLFRRLSENKLVKLVCSW